MDPLCQMYRDAAAAQRWDELAAIHAKMINLGYVWRNDTCYPPGTLPGAPPTQELLESWGITPETPYQSPWVAAPVSIGGWETGAVGTPGSCMYMFMMEAKAAGLSYQAALNAWGSLPEGQCTYKPPILPATEPVTEPAPEPAQEITTIPTTPAPETTPGITTTLATPSPVTPSPETVTAAPASFFGFMTNEMAANIIVLIAVIAFILLLASGGGKS